MKAVIAGMNVSTGGVLRIAKSIKEMFDIKPGDKIIMIQDTENGKITLQFQRGNKVVALLDGAELVKV
jgi:bifunctional DNA-binding transcriptional regulator/antitoxin component of YhaV-PrlF toxin-antitoxin module